MVSYKNADCIKNNKLILSKYFGIEEITNEYKITIGIKDILKVKDFICRSSDLLQSHNIMNKQIVKVVATEKENLILEGGVVISYKEFCKSFFYKFCVTIHCIQGYSCKIYMNRNEIKNIIKMECADKDSKNRIFYTIISRSNININA
jgi:hypothetical protein